MMTMLFLFLGQAYAGDITLDNLTQDDVTKISKEFSANFVHTIVAPASTYGKVFGFELGVVGGLTKTPNINRISKTFDPSADIEMIPHAGLALGVSVPFGITGELSMIPSTKLGDVTLQNTSFALKWTFTELTKLPFDMAVRLHAGSSDLSYADVVDTNVNANVKWETSSSGANLEISKKLLFFEPYFGFGTVSTETKIGVSAATNVNIFTFTTAQSYTAKNSGSQVYGGFNLNLFILKIGAEASSVMGVSKYAGKISFYF